MKSVSQCLNDVTDGHSNEPNTLSKKKRLHSRHCVANYWQVGSVISCVLINIFVGGVPNSYGVLYTYMQEPLGITEFHLSWIGALMTGSQGIASVLATILIDNAGCRKTAFLGPVLVVSGFVISSQTSSVYLIYFTLGVLPGLGMGFTYIASMVYVNGQFTRWRPVAVGTSVSALAIGMLLWPPLTSGIADIMGWRGTLLIQGGMLLHLVPCALLIKQTSTLGEESGDVSNGQATSLLDNIISYLRFLSAPRVALLCLAHFFYGLSYYSYSSFIPTYVTTSYPTITKQDAALIISIVGFGSLSGRILSSGVSMLHVKNPQYIYLSTLALCGILNIMVPICKDTSAFFANGTIFGLFFGCYTAMTFVMLVNLHGLEKLSQTFGSTQCCVGVGSLCGPPLESYIATVFNSPDLIFFTAGGFYIISAICILPLVVNRSILFEKKSSSVEDVAGKRNDGFTTENTVVRVAGIRNDGFPADNNF